VAGNYYPCNAAAYLKDDAGGAQLSVLVDRSVGVASLSEGSLEAMVHRRLLADDSRGVGEPLNETASITANDDPGCSACRVGPGITVRGSHLLSLRSADTALAALRPAMDRAFAPLVLAFGTVDALPTAAADKPTDEPTDKPTDKAAAALPSNVKLLTLQAVNETAFLLRLEHTFAVGEDPVLSAPVTVNVTTFFASIGLQVVDDKELTLTANQLLEDLTYLDWTAAGASRGQPPGTKAPPMKPMTDGQVTLGPMEIRTSLVIVQ
jgi:alpha-mannosidase